MALKRTIDALVIGAGPVGLTAALTLVRQGQRAVEIIDEAERGAGLSYALALDAPTLEKLEDLGVAAELADRGNRIDKIALYDGVTRRGDLSLAKLHRRYPFVLVLPQSEIEGVLLAALADAGVSVRWNHRLRRLEDVANGVVACTIDRIDAESSGYAFSKVGHVVGKTFEREIPLVIGADGHASLVRRQMEINLQEVAPSGTFAAFELEGETLPDDVPADNARREARITIVDGLRSVWWPLRGRRTRLGFELPADDVPTAERTKSRLPSIVPWLATELDEGRLRDLVAKRLPWHAAPSGRLMWSVGIRFERALATAFGRGRVWLAGDAAHLAFPFGVRSMNEGIVEAEDLARRCAQVLAGTGSLASLASYGNERLVRWQALVAAARAGTMPTDPWLRANAGRIVEALPVATVEGAELLARITS
jgi:2-polyprenyl-6-methoxyphenol hydroxylase-like FAD-dependent oxidoreductase